MRIQFWGDVGGTGFGTVTSDLGEALLALGHDVRFASQGFIHDDLQEPYRTWDEDGRIFRVTPSMVDHQLALRAGDDEAMAALTPQAILKLIRGELWPDGWKAEGAIILGDFSNVERFVMADEDTAAAFASLPTLHYVPIEGTDLPPIWGAMWQVIHPIAMCERGADEVEKVTGRRPPVVYHGVDTEQFRPVSPERPLYMGGMKLRSKADCKRFFGRSPHERWIFRADRHMPRKRYASLLRAVAPVLEERPDTFLVIHCGTSDQGGKLRYLQSKFPKVAHQIVFTGFHDAGKLADRNILAALYNAADIYASPSAEGFGLTIAEALSCGTPAVGMDYSSVTEVIGPGGLLAPLNYLMDNEYDYAWGAVNEPIFGARVATLLDNPGLRVKLGRKGRQHVVASFQWDKAALQFSGALRDLLNPASVEVAA